MTERLPSSIEVLVVERPWRLYRVTPASGDARFAEAFHSHYEKGLEPRGIEVRAAVIHMALSMFVSADASAQLAKRYPKFGGHVATMRLVPNVGFCVAKTGSPGHWSVWGRPVEFLDCVEAVWKPGG
jgi:hypothetical protein